ncbi:MAG: tRNA uridine-5-carboxymethylaminomethyl(34) synthesis GTPase MnmE [Rhodobacteraceae bacterium]|nr:tRNA uridine-5-carboxymethylaminomethyl(34) synthesis GTPase MnmE [Paracoccaceae bacterium]
MDTIYALATARGRAGLAVIRISGPDAFQALVALAGRVGPPRHAARVVLSRDGEILDDGLAIPFPGPASFTGEDVVELHLHGAPAVISAVLSALAAIPALRMAEPGEFTRRALANGKLDLSQAEALAELIDAETEAQRRQAQRLMSGYLGQRVEVWRTDLVQALALLETTIDFVDEDVPTQVSDEVCLRIDRVKADLRRELSGAAAAERIREGFEVAILGEPNVGKSTLLNRLAGREAAITSAIAGTTRDVIEVRMDLGGLAVTVMDTAGIRESAEAIERIGIDRALARGADADLRVVLTVDGRVPDGVQLQPGDIVVGAKADETGHGVSGRTGAGVDDLVARIVAELSGRAAGAGGLTRERHRVAAERAQTALAAARAAIYAQGDRTDIAAEELRAALRALESLVGAVGVEDILDEIFARFCIGK